MRFNFSSLIKRISPTLVQTGIVTLSKIAMAMAVMALQILLARLLGPEGRGSYAVIIIFSSGIASFFILGTDRAIQQQVVSGRMQNGEAISLTWLLILVLSLLGSLFALLFVYYGADLGLGFFSQASTKEFSLSLLLMAPLLYSTSLQLLFYANANFISSSIFMVGEPVLRMGLLLALFLFFQITVINVIWAALAAGFAVSIVGSIFFIKQNVLGAIRLPDMKRVLAVVSYGIRYLPARFGNFFRTHVITIFLASMTGKAEIGIYAVATGLAGGCLFISEAINAVLQTKILADSGVYREMVAKYMRLVGGATSLIITLMVAALVMLVPLLFGRDFHFVATLLWFLLPGLIFSTLSGPLSAYFVCTNKPQVISLGVMAEIIVSIAVLLILYPYWGVIGAPIAVSTGKVTQFLIQLFKFKTVCGSGLKTILVPGRSDLKAVIDFINIFRNTPQ
jgi:O-antigen/teichoic acid export membrane protein